MNNPNVDKQKHKSSPGSNNIYGEMNGRMKRETTKKGQHPTEGMIKASVEH